MVERDSMRLWSWPQEKRDTAMAWAVLVCLFIGYLFR